MNKYKWLLAAIVTVLCMTSCSLTPPPQPPSSAGIKPVGANQVELTSGQNLSLSTSKWIGNYYRPAMPGPFHQETRRTFAFDGQHVTLAVWAATISYHATTGEIVSIYNGVDFQLYDLNVPHIGDRDVAYDGMIVITRVRDDAVRVAWPMDTHVI